MGVQAQRQTHPQLQPQPQHQPQRQPQPQRQSPPPPPASLSFSAVPTIRPPTFGGVLASSRPAGPGPGEGNAGKRPCPTPLTPPPASRVSGWAPRLPAKWGGPSPDPVEF